MAAGKSKNLTVRFIADTSKWTKPYNRVSADIGNLEKSEKKVKDSFKKIGGEAQKLGTQVGSPTGLAGMLDRARGFFTTMIPGGMLLKIGGITAAIIAMKKALSAVISAGIQTEDAITKLTVLLGGDANAALKMYRDALEFSVITPFDPKDVVNAAVVAGQYGANAFEKGALGMKGNVIKLIADMAAFSGQSMEEAATALMRGDLALLEKYGKAARDAYNLAKQAGPLQSQPFIQTFVTAMEKVPLWAGMAEKRSQTISGLWSTIQGNVGLIFTYLSGAAEGGQAVTFWSSLRDIVKGFSDGFAEFVAMIKPLLVDIGGAVGGLFRTLWNFIRMVLTLFGPQLKVVLGAFYLALRGVFWILSKILNGIADSLNMMTNGIKALYAWLDQALGISDAMGKVFEFAEGIVIKAQTAGLILRMTFRALISEIKQFLSLVPDLFSGLGKKVEGVYESGKSTIKGLLGFGEGPGLISRGVNLVGDVFGSSDIPPQQAAPAPTSNVTNVSTQMDNSSRVTNVYSGGGDTPEWMMRNPYDITGKPALSGGF